MKKLIIFLLIFFPISIYAYDVELNGIFYDLNKDAQTASVVSGWPKYSGDIIIPNNIEVESVNYTVTSFGQGAFSQCKELTSISIPSSIISISAYCFNGCIALTTITLPKSINYIGMYAFQNCTNLSSVNITDFESWCKIEFDSYYSNPLIYAHHLYLNGQLITSFKVPDGISIIDKLLNGLSDLTSIYIPRSVSEIKANAFEGCDNIDSLVFQNGLDTLIVEEGSLGDINIKNLYLGRNLKRKAESSKIYMPFYNIPTLTNLTIGANVTYFDPYYFEGCYKIENLCLEDGEEELSIGDASRIYSPFSKCPISKLHIGRNLAGMGLPFAVSTPFTVTFGDKITSISRLSNCKGLSSISIPNSVKTIENGTFQNTSLINIVLPNSVTEIGSSAFSNCISLKTVTLSDSLSTISWSMFDGCESLTTISIPESVIEIGGWAFNNCSSLNNPVIPPKVSNIGIRAFYGCSSISSVNIPSSVKTIGGWAFRECKNLREVILENGTDTLEFLGESSNNESFYNCPLTSVFIGRHIYYTRANYSRKSPFQLGTIKKAIIDINMTPYDGNAFKNSSIDTVSITNNVTKLDTEILQGWSGLKYVLIADETTSLDFGAGGNFKYCPLDSVYLGRSMTYSSESPFRYNREGLKHLAFGNFVTELGDVDFLGLIALTSLELPHSLKKIGSQTFYGCKGLTSLTIPNSVTEIGKQAFDLCTSLKSVTIEGGTEELVFVAEEGFVTNTFSNSPLEEITIGRNFSFASVSPFSIQENLSTITIGEKVTKLDDKSFTACPKLVNVTSYSEVVPTINDMAFTPSYLSNATLHVPYSLYDQYKVTPQWKDFGKIVNFEGLYNLVYIVDGVEYKKSVVEQGTSIVAEEEPTKEGHTFSGWSEIPNTMPDHDVTITGTFNINKYKLTYKIDEAEYKSYEVEFGASIIAEPTPQKEGYTFSGWSEIPATMPAHDVTITGSFSINKYKLTYQVDGVEYKTYEVEYNASITPEAEPTKEGYTFSGWSDIPTTMPAKDVTITGTFSINKYKLTYMIDDKVYKETMYEYGATITPEPKPEGDYATFEWKDLPQTMPAHDVVVYASYTSGIVEVLMATQRNMRIYTPNGKKLNKPQKGLNIIVLDDGTVKKVIVK